ALEWVVIENNALASRNLGDCSTLSPEACGKAKELSQRILDKGLPSVEDMRGKLASCQDDSCRKGVWTEYRQASDATINTLKQMALNGELSREELAFINHELGKELAVSGYRANDKLGRSEQSSWLNGGGGPLSGFFNTELRQKELENAGLSKADAAQYVKEEQRNMLVLETAVGAIGGAASNKIQASGSAQGGKAVTSQIDTSLQQANKNLPTIRKGNITHEPLAKPDSNEMKAGEGFAKLGYDVKYKATASDLGIKDVRTPDLYVNGVGKVDVYTPKTAKPKNIIAAIEKKDSQTSSVLTQIDLPGKEMKGIADRIWGKPNVKNINTLFFQDSKGKIHRFDRPTQGGQ
ncbi:hypothetical protein ID853_17345, partial [Xenorhabdus sp. Vera]|uniref:CdiA C-terminal domain-containing protein n=1 Tax=Xenorhabdus koppenhoeferi TaxID=351659 RepID=UPI0019BCA311